MEENTHISPKQLYPILLKLLEETNERNPKTAKQLKNEIQAYSMRKFHTNKTLSIRSIQRQIKTWNDTDAYHIESHQGGKNRGYYMVSFPIEAPEALMIAQSLFRAQNFTKGKTVKLLERLRTFTDATGREHIDLMIQQLRKSPMRLRTGRKEVFAYINVLMEAIRHQKQVSFYCYKWDIGDHVKNNDDDFVLDIKGEKKKFTVSPYYVVWEGDECWLICHYPDNDPAEGHILSHFRISRMTQLTDQYEDEEGIWHPLEDTISIGKMLEFERYIAPKSYPINMRQWTNTSENRKRAAEGKKLIMHKDVALKEFYLDRYLRENIYMRHNVSPPITLTLWFRESSVGEIMSRFAIDRKRIKPRQIKGAISTDDEVVFSAEVTVQPNEGMYMWLLEHSGEIVVAKPDDIREEMKRRLNIALKGLESYEKFRDESVDDSDSMSIMYGYQRKYLQKIEFD